MLATTNPDRVTVNHNQTVVRTAPGIQLQHNQTVIRIPLGEQLQHNQTLVRSTR
jgi:hypothetical protein